jgi:hypothetical protein
VGENGDAAMMAPDSVGRKIRRAEDVIALCDIRAGFEPLRARGFVAHSPFRPLAVSLPALVI